MSENNLAISDVIILGAGPAGCACGLALRDSGLSVNMIDKHIFPRDKVCGDAIPGRAVKLLNEIYPEFNSEFSAFDKKLITKKTICYHKKKELEFSWKLDAYTCTRMNFDNFLICLVKSKTSTIINEGIEIREIIKTENGFILESKDGIHRFSCKILIAADGINGIASKKLAGFHINRNHHIGALRKYYSGINNLENNRTEIYFDKKYLPGYFWIFPVQGGIANVGFGMLSAKISGKQLNIKKAFYDFIERSDILTDKFSDAKPESDLDGCGIPLGSRWVKMSGDHFLITGDAASLVDPVSGDGIGNAVLSGKIAAEQVIECFKKNNFTEPFMNNYSLTLFKIIGNEMKKKARVIKYLSEIPFLFDIAFTVGKFNFFKKLIK